MNDSQINTIIIKHVVLYLATLVQVPRFMYAIVIIIPQYYSAI